MLTHIDQYMLTLGVVAEPKKKKRKKKREKYTIKSYSAPFFRDGRG